MSESCPNCGSAEITFRYGKARWICGSHGHGADYFPHQTTVCELIRSLREELAEARDAERDRIADWHDARAKDLDGVRGYLCEEHKDDAAAIRNNEHRSDT